LKIAEKIRWGRKIFFKKNILPEQITFFVTDRCDLRCQHCFYREKLNKGKEPSLWEIKKVSKNLGKFSFLTLTGGEPFLREDLPEIAEVFALQNEVGRISIPTNGFLPERIFSISERILKKCPKTKILVKVSIDGTEEIHDKIRGIKGSFKKAVNTFYMIKLLKEKHKNFRTGILFTISKLNENNLFEAFDFVKNSLKPDVIGLNYIRGKLEENIKEVSFLNYETLYRKIFKCVENAYFYRAYKKFVVRKIARITRTKIYPMRCFAGIVSGVIDENLDVFPCEGLKLPMGNLRDFNYNFIDLWFSRKAKEVRKFIRRKNCFCTNECNIQNNSFFNFKTLTKILIQTTKEIMGNV